VILEAYHSKGISIPEGVIQAIMNRSWNKEMKKWDAFFRSLAE
jgi:hypothetical protein